MRVTVRLTPRARADRLDGIVHLADGVAVLKASVAAPPAEGRANDALLRSLDERPPSPGLVQTRDADDHHALQLLSRNNDVTALATHPGAVRLLWEVCQIPDFRKIMSDSHARFLAHCFVF